ncbi:MAG: hypothetical protein JSS09_08190 [Verrucomicrobia bacterium]|nr:hypothetical protein [Verrucomicrobiota bacterium]
MMRVLRAFAANITNRSLTSSSSPQKYLPIKSCEKDPSCECPVVAQKVESYVTKSKLTPEEVLDLHKEGQQCTKVQSLKNQWSSYNLTIETEQPKCKLYETLKHALPLIASSEHIKTENGALTISSSTDLSAFISEEGKVNLAGEGGGIVGKRGYWESVLPSLEDFKTNKQLKVISIGGAVGFDAEKTAEIFTQEGFSVTKPVVVDPNGLASYLASLRGTVDHHPVTSQTYFSKAFSRTESEVCVFHLGTTLNVLPEEIAVNILEGLGENSSSHDIVSLLLVDEVQFTTGREPKKYLEVSSEVNDQGFAKVAFKETGKHYKTVIKDPAKFEQFMDSLGFSGRLETRKSGGVNFLCYKGSKR